MKEKGKELLRYCDMELKRKYAYTLTVVLFAVFSFFSVRNSVHAYKVNIVSSGDNRVCFVCHQKKEMKKKLPSGKIISLYVENAQFKQSTHGGKPCTTCHVDIIEVPHKKEIEYVNCSRCHYLGSTMPVPKIKKYAQYQESVHKKALDRGVRNAPTCQDCHGTHDIISPKNKNSAMNHFNIPKTCGKCHLDIYSEYRESIHGVKLLEGNKDVPVCTNCHGEHNIVSPRDARSTVSTLHIPETCGKCHGAIRIMSKYGMEAEKLKTYKESYHGVANQFGSLVVANCASCHTAHDIRPSDDPKSSVHKKNIPKTCGKCHKNVNENIAKGKMHLDPTKKEEGSVFYLSSFFKWLTMGTMIALIMHIFLDLSNRIRRRNKER